MSKQRVVIVTGAGTGIGRAIAHRFAKEGDTVYIIGRRPAKLEETAHGFENIKSVTADLTDIAAVENLRDKILTKNKVIDVLVNNAGGVARLSEDAPLKEIAKLWQEIIDTNLSSAYYMISAFGPHLKQPGGRIVNISSSAALVGSTSGGFGGQSYSAAKAGLHGLNMTLVHEYGSKGVTVNTVSPGVIDSTGFFGGDGVPEDRKTKYYDRIPLTRLGKPEEIAAAVYFLASEEAGFVTGEILNVSGGMTLGR